MEKPKNKSRGRAMCFKPYDPTWVVELAKQQCSDRPWLAESLANCVQCHEKRLGRKNKCIYIYFVDPAGANQPGAEWQYNDEVGITLMHPVFGRIIIDILKDNRVGGIEFLDRLLKT